MAPGRCWGSIDDDRFHVRRGASRDRGVQAFGVETFHCNGGTLIEPGIVNGVSGQEGAEN